MVAQTNLAPFAFLPSPSSSTPQSPTPITASQLHKLLRILKTTPSNVPYRHLKDLLLPCLSIDQISLLAATCYLALLSATPLAYDELQFSASLCCATRFVRTTVNTSTASDISTEQQHAPLSLFLDFTAILCTLIDSQSLNVDDASVATTIVDVIAHFLSSGHLQAICKAALSISTALLQTATTKVNGVIYKRVFPLVSTQLPSANRKALSELLIQTAAFEAKLYSSPKPCTESDTTPDSLPKQPQLPIANFLIKAVQHAPERADRRTAISDLIFIVLDKAPNSVHSALRAALPRLARHPRYAVRLFTAELVAIFIAWRSSPDESGIDHSSLLHLLNVLSGRSADKIPVVRTKALASLAEALRSLKSDVLQRMLPHFLKIAFSIQSRLRDPKSRVRKAAVDLVGVTVHSHLTSAADDLNVMADDNQSSATTVPKYLQLVTLLRQRSFDTVSTVRICTISHLTSILLDASGTVHSSSLNRLFSLWTEAVLPLATDTDARCQEACFKSIESVLLSQMTTRRQSKVKHSPEEQVYNLSDMFLAVLGGSRLREMELCSKAVVALCKKGVFGSREISYLSKTVLAGRDDTEGSAPLHTGAWMMLAEIASSGKVSAVTKTVRRSVVLEEVFEHLNASACKIAGMLAPTLDDNDKKKLATATREILFTDGNWKRYDWIDSVPAVVELLSSLDNTIGSELLDRCEKHLLNTEDVMEERRNISLLTTVGSICVSFKLSREPPAAIATYVQALASNVQKSSKTRAFALTTLGKLCLCEGDDSAKGRITRGSKKGRSSRKMGEALTRRYLSVFVHELENATTSATRNNAVVVLCDLCRQYTAVVEPYIPRLANLLADPSEFVRVQVISSLIGLLQEDYIKIRSGPVFYEIVKCLLDSSQAVRGTAEYAILDIIPQKNQSLLAVCFVELIFVLNECTDCSTYNQFPVALQKKQMNESESDAQEQRKKIYQAFLKGMSVDQRLRLSGRFRSDIIALVAEGKLPLSSSAVIRVLDDTLMLLCCSEIRSAVKSVGNDADGEENTTDNAAKTTEALNNAKKASLVNKLQFVELRETTIPALLELRHHLEKERSSLLSSLMKCICTLLTPYKENLNTVIADAQVRSEIIHELEFASQDKNKARAEKGNQRKRASARRDGSGTQCDIGKAAEPQANTLCTPVGKQSKGRGDVLSVPRTRSQRKRKIVNVTNSDSDSDEDFAVSGFSDRVARTELLSARIEASPKLASIARRGADRMESSCTVDINESTSGFAAALARIESASADVDRIGKSKQR